MKRKLINIIILGMAIMLTACGGEKESQQENNLYSDEIKQEDKTEREEKNEYEELKNLLEEVLDEAEQENQNMAVPLKLQVSEQYEVEGMENVSDGQGYITLCEVSWQNLVLAEESAEAYPNLAKKLQERNIELNESYQGIKEDLRLSAEEIYEFQKEYFYPLSSNNSYAVQRADNHILSIREDFSDYWGGAHGMYGSVGINYDINTGEELVITDVITDIETLPAILSEKIKEQCGDEYETFETLEETLKGYTAENYSWTMGYEGITFYFQPYEIASYAMGLIKADIWYDEMPELFREEYVQIENEGYSIALSMNQEVEVDLDVEDNKKNCLFISEHYETAEEIEYGIKRISIMIDDCSYYETECYGYEINPYLLCVGEPERKKYYLYVETVAENDYKTISVYGIKDGEITLNGRLDGTGFAGIWDETEGEYGTYYKNVFNNPKEFALETKLDILGTFGGVRNYVINTENGFPQAMEEYYVLPQNSFPIESIIPLEVVMLPKEKTEELSAGTNYYPIRTDGKTYVDMRLEDGRECRIYVESEGWDWKINGVDQWDCFETLWYAG